jgi:hypothetical protein
VSGGALAAVAAAWLLGLGVVALVWPRTTSLPGLTWLALAGLTGPCAAGAAFMLLGLAGFGPAARWTITSIAVVASVVGWWRRCRLPAEPPRAGRFGLLLVVLLAAAATGAVAQRTHLGWDGTVVWLHKARMLTASDGVMPRSAIADATRSWTAPDYPLHVPSAMAWVLRWQGQEDERGLKLLPAAWYAAVLCLVAAAIRQRTRSVAPAVLGVLVIATAPRLLAGEGSLTSGYADGPLAGLLGATWWIASQGDWGRDARWTPLLVVLAACLAWTKQEGAVDVVIIAMACAWSARRASAVRFALPALGIAVLWHLWVRANHAPVTMAYAFAGLATTFERIPVVGLAYLRETTAWEAWGALWPTLVALWLAGVRRHDPRDVVVLAGVLTTGGIAFLFSAWPDLATHLQVTVGRQLVQVVPAAVILTFSGTQRRTNAQESAA